MRSAPFGCFVVADSLGWLLFLTKISFSRLENFWHKKSFENIFDARVSACACAKVRDQCFRPSSAFGCAWSNSIVPVCLRSVKFLRVLVQCCVCWTLPPFTRFWVGPVNGPHLGPILQAQPPPGAVSNHAVDGGFEP